MITPRRDTNILTSGPRRLQRIVRPCAGSVVRIWQTHITQPENCCTTDGEVFWTDQGTTPLPDDIIKRFDGKVMAIMGYEQDQVIVDPLGKPGQNPDKDTSVPIK